MDTGTVIKELRVKRKISQKDLVKKLGISQGYLSLIERGEREPSLDLVKKIAKSLDLPQVIFFLQMCDDSSENRKYLRPIKKIAAITNDILRSI